jgi:hypothetical protein
VRRRGARSSTRPTRGMESSPGVQPGSRPSDGRVLCIAPRGHGRERGTRTLRDWLWRPVCALRPPYKVVAAAVKAVPNWTSPEGRRPDSVGLDCARGARIEKWWPHPESHWFLHAFNVTRALCPPCGRGCPSDAAARRFRTGTGPRLGARDVQSRLRFQRTRIHSDRSPFGDLTMVGTPGIQPGPAGS